MEDVWIGTGGGSGSWAGSDLSSVITTDSILASEATLSCEKVRQISIAPLFAEAIRRINQEKSVSVLFK